MKRYICGFCFMLIGIALLTGQQKFTLDRAIHEAQKKIEHELPEGTKILVLNFNAPTARLSDYVLEKLARGIINSKKLMVIEPKESDPIKQERAYQYSEEVSDEEIRSLGRRYGAQSIVSGKFDERLYGFSITVINVESAVVEASYQTDIRKEKKLDTLLGWAEPEKLVQTEPQQHISQSKPASAPRKTKFILGLRGGLNFMFNELDNSFRGFASETSHQQGQVFAAYFGTNNLTSLLGFQVEADLILKNSMTAKKSEDSTESSLVFSYTSLDIPFLLRMGILDRGMINLFAGPYLSIPLTNLTLDSSLSDKTGNSGEYEIEKLLSFMGSYGILGGLSAGLKAGPGVITLDGRYMYDFNEIAYKDNDRTQSLFKRQGINVTVGYELWL